MKDTFFRAHASPRWLGAPGAGFLLPSEPAVRTAKSAREIEELLCVWKHQDTSQRGQPRPQGLLAFQYGGGRRRPWHTAN